MKELTTYTIYKHPKDYPLGYVMRQWIGVNGHGEPRPGTATRHLTLRAARSLIPVGLVCLRRDPADDPCIFETWL